MPQVHITTTRRLRKSPRTPHTASSVVSSIVFFSVRFLRYMRTVSSSYAKRSSLVVYAGERHGAQPYQSGVSVGTGKVR